ncbi:hypothetical protein BCR32DRAFT_329538 [Anaeromyces robustus]|uniref:HAUS augmin-like complex subunit 6 N-terminal domain-containing protein n=1 Tax=Anaeromyces robustus TaxID=1754192 RepID=A0A1Y1WS09_9FUNG|nr:hypothetical protein BCR32DRAFT_329538 [Anaeromyces robustus]|eukprot:ORX76046.1 hypothetical protein BCR32DRAFT_329538 [Anaeromyces robustus]
MSKTKITIPSGCPPETILTTNLHLLQYPSNINIEMFSNKSVFFNVIHFLFNIIDPEQTKKNFTECWPVYNSKTTQKFKSVAHKLCDALKKEGKIPNYVIIRPTLFDDYGERSKIILLELSSYALRIKLKKTYSGYLKETGAQLSVQKTKEKGYSYNFIKKTIQVQIIRQNQIFINNIKNYTEDKDKWISFGKQLSDISKKINLSYNKNIQKYYELENVSTTLSPITPNIENILEPLKERENRINEISERWYNIIEWINNNKSKIESTENIIDGNSNNIVINSSDVVINIPEEFNLDDSFNKKEIVLQNGKLNFEEYVKSWNLSLSCLSQVYGLVKDEQKENKALIKSLTNNMNTLNGIPDMNQACSSIENYIKFHEGYLGNIRILKQKLRNKISDIENSIEATKAQIKILLENDNNNDNINNINDLIMEPISPMFKIEKNDNSSENINNIKMNFSGIKKTPKSIKDHSNIKREQSSSPQTPVRNFKKTKIQNSPKRNTSKSSNDNASSSLTNNKNNDKKLLTNINNIKSPDLYKTPEKKINQNISSSLNILNNLNQENYQTDSSLLPFIITPSSLKLFKSSNLFDVQPDS